MALNMPELACAYPLEACRTLQHLQISNVSIALCLG